ncbi:hypothetical protein DR999_PMT21520 [Platysternon megacephalum]|uniref:Uncharacterized protein n=1 Tax=Platysternon megacephalum TaxID=55544 RepID=A0A4D9DHE4_9SAUR|nr:hypothetical protein DR999_PMT21520 [Platysternon megacephalum]
MKLQIVAAVLLVTILSPKRSSAQLASAQGVVSSVGEAVDEVLRPVGDVLGGVVRPVGGLLMEVVRPVGDVLGMAADAVGIVQALDQLIKIAYKRQFERSRTGVQTVPTFEPWSSYTVAHNSTEMVGIEKIETCGVVERRSCVREEVFLGIYWGNDLWTKDYELITQTLTKPDWLTSMTTPAITLPVLLLHNSPTNQMLTENYES